MSGRRRVVGALWDAYWAFVALAVVFDVGYYGARLLGAEWAQ